MSNARNLANLLGTKTKVKDVDVDGTALILDADGDTSIEASSDDIMVFDTAGSERLRLDGSGNTFVSKTSAARTTVGHELHADGFTRHTVSGDKVLEIVRTSSDGEILEFFKDTTLIGHVGSRGGADLYVGSGDTNLKFAAGSDVVVPANTDGADRDNAVDLGNSSSKFKDLYLSGGLYVGGTGSANYLTDYEIGTWTPAFTSSGASFSYSSQFGTYVKVGGLVQVQFYLLATASGTTSNATTITGLPFAVANINPLHQSACAVWFTGTVDPRPLFNNSQSAITLWKKGAVLISTAGEVNNAYLVGSGTYRAS